MRDPSSRLQPPPSPAGPGTRGVLAALLAAAGFALALHDLSNANRPHELTWAPAVTLLSAASTVLAIRSLTLLVPRLRARATAGRVLGALGLLAVAGIAALLFVGASSTAVGNLLD